ncbi:hypothetical protein BGZ89_002255 [Linnemannia elongata]|uniref:Uncharacterized protein n=1 Tax=Linnemannia elongata AG-77 TaxID=1314771 RepID=A0A197K0T6_9FUNG|nr:hypothetical protein BGZ89_002255 [Linnemannia elongata]OAQ30818.1 hypothetical protein K457DRAFT_136761 [Linnemannia elongata AG-77]
MSDSIGHDATPHPRDASHNNHANDSDSDSDNVSTPQFLSRPHSRQGNTSATAGTESVTVTATATTTTTTTTTATKPREAFRPSVFGQHTRTKESKSSSSSKSKRSSGTVLHSEDSDSDSNSDNEKEGGRGRKKSGSRRRRFSDSASHLLAQAPPVPDLRFDNNYRKALNQIYETHAKESALATGSSTITLDASTDEKKPASGALQQTQQGGKRVPSIAARVTVMTLRDIIIMPFIHGFFWGFGTILLTLVGQRSLVYHVQRTWRQIFGGNPDEVVNASRGQPARVRRIGGGGGGFGLGGIGLSNAGSAGVGAGGFARPGHVY